MKNYINFFCIFIKWFKKNFISYNLKIAKFFFNKNTKKLLRFKHKYLFYLFLTADKLDADFTRLKILEFGPRNLKNS